MPLKKTILLTKPWGLLPGIAFGIQSVDAVPKSAHPESAFCIYVKRQAKRLFDQGRIQHNDRELTRTGVKLIYSSHTAYP